MVKKYMNQLYKEIEHIRRMLTHDNVRYFDGFGNVMSFTVILKDGSYFYIGIGTKEIPKIKKKDIAFIEKELFYDPTEQNNKYNNKDYFTSDNGFCRFFDSSDHIKYHREKIEKYKMNYDKFIDTGCW